MVEEVGGRLTIAPLRAAVLLLAGILFLGCTEITRTPPTPAPTQAPPATVQATATRPPGGVTAVPPVVQTPQAVTTSLTPITPTVGASTGGPVSVTDIEQAWIARGMTVSADEAGPFSGLGTAPRPLKVTRGTDTSAVTVFSYPNQRALEEDWNVGAGAPTPKAGKNAGSFVAAWWNQNTIVVLRTRGDTTDDDARDAFLALGPAVSPVGPVPLATTLATVISGGTRPDAGPVATSTPRPAGPTSTPVPTATRPAPGPTLAPPR